MLVGPVLRSLTWTIRVGAFVLIGIETFVPRAAPDGTARAVTGAAYALSGVLMAAWGWSEARGGARAARAGDPVPYLIGGIMAVSGFACPFAHGSGLLGLALVAGVAAGSDPSLIFGWAVTGTGIVAVEAGALVTGAGRTATVYYPLILLVGLLGGLNRRTYRVRAELSAALLRQAGELRAEQERTAVLDERARIAREIHDVLAHSLGALNIQIQTARSLLAHHDPGRADEILATAQRMSTDGLAETRRAVQALRTDMPPLPETLGAITAEHRSRHHTPATLTVEGAAAPLPPEQVLCLTRTAQEALTNAAKHAPGQPVGLALRYGKDDVTLVIGNQMGAATGEGMAGGEGTAGTAGGGQAFTTVDGGFGLTGMRERLLLAGGTLTAGTGPGTGPGARQWTVTARVPR